MNKRLTAETNVRAVNMLKELGINYEYGFMLFDPTTTYESVQENLDFLKKICGDGSAPLTFCKMIPYAGPPLSENSRKKAGSKSCGPGTRITISSTARLMIFTWPPPSASTSGSGARTA